jgi:RNA polymerase sigma-70 factor (ECF subfamily)
MDPGAPFPDLLCAAQEGDEGAFVQLYRSTHPALLRYLAVVAGPLAEDVASDTWVSVIRDLGNFSGYDAGAFRAWVLNIARRRWVDEVRRRSRRPELLTDAFPETAGHEDLAANVAAADSASRIIGLVRTLPADQAEVVTLRVVTGFDVPETAAAIGKSPGAVRVLAHRGLRRLAVLLEEDGGHAPARAVTQRAASSIVDRGDE